MLVLARHGRFSELEKLLAAGPAPADMRKSFDGLAVAGSQPSRRGPRLGRLAHIDQPPAQAPQPGAGSPTTSEPPPSNAECSAMPSMQAA